MGGCTKNTMKNLLLRRIPIVQWLPKYDKVKFISDFIAGITVGLTMIPQSLAYASLADLPPQYGLYTAFMGSFAYVFFGTIKEASIGPTSLMALLVYSYTEGKPLEYVILLCFLSGCVEFLMGVLKLGFLVDFISKPVISGFTSATSVIIVLTQLKGVLGLRCKSHGILSVLKCLITELKTIQIADATVGITCMIALLGIKKIASLPTKNPKVKKALWFLSISRNAFVVFFCALIAFLYEKKVGKTPFRLSNHVPSGLPTFQAPPFSTTANNETVTFSHMLHDLGSGIVVVPIVAILANVAIAKSFAAGKLVDATQEMIALGLCNIFGSFVQSMPATGAFTRSAVAHTSGVTTPLQGIYSGSIILLALSFLTPFFYYIPRSTLSAVLICAVITLIDYEIVPKLWKCNKFDLVLLLTTFTVSVFFGVELGLLAGAIISVASLLKPWTRPQISITHSSNKIGQNYVLIKPELGLLFPAVDYISEKVLEQLTNTDEDTTIILDFTNILKVDFSACTTLNNLLEVCEKKDRPITFQNVKSHVYNMLEHVIKKEHLYLCNETDNVYEDLPSRKWDQIMLPLVKTEKDEREREEQALNK